MEPFILLANTLNAAKERFANVEKPTLLCSSKYFL